MSATSKICPFSSMISPGFWQKFSEISLVERKSVASTFDIWGYYGPSTVKAAIFSVDHSSFNEIPSTYYNQIPVRGRIISTKSKDEFKNLDKNALIAENFNVNGVEDMPSLLVKFIILVNADLKSYNFTYWFGFPGVSSIQLTFESSIELQTILLEKMQSYDQVWKSGFFLTNLENGSLKSIRDDLGTEIFGYVEPSGIPECPGWIIRNYLYYITRKRGLQTGDTVKLLSLNPTKSEITKSRLYSIKIELSQDWETCPKILGWERNHDKLVPRMVDLKSNLDPLTLSKSFVDFNLKLMKWRLFPDFDLEMMHDLKVCLLGAGTLGCNVARALMGWGVRHLSIVDSGKVSYSNPVRQSLYTYKDSGKPKAATAAERLQEIFPGMIVDAYDLLIPMPGHPCSPSMIKSVEENFRILENLVQSHNVIFLMTDTRESRWLPTLLGAAHNKLVINAALGFESYVVLRHGRDNEDLGCYFCTDVVAPGDSTSDRTLDQQCTVTRPGLSMIASGLAVELMAAVLHYDKGPCLNYTLGIPPHSLRGWISLSQHIYPRFSKFDKCSACSKAVVDAFRENGINLLFNVLENPTYLENLSGLSSLKEGIDGIVEMDDFFSDDSC